MKQLCVGIVISIMVLSSSCSNGMTSGSFLEPATTVITNIRFTQSPQETYVLFNIEVNPTAAVANTTYVVSLVSNDGHFFGETFIAWTENELKGPSEGERDYIKIKEAEQIRIKNVTLGAPANDKDIVALKKDYDGMIQKLCEDQLRSLQRNVQQGDLVEFLKSLGVSVKPSKEDISNVFNKHLRVKVTNKEEYMKLKYPDGDTQTLMKFKGKGSYKTPFFSAKYQYLSFTWRGNPSGSFTETLFSSDGRKLSSCTLAASPDKDHSTGATVDLSKQYYLEIVAPDQMEWEFTVIESNIPP